MCFFNRNKEKETLHLSKFFCVFSSSDNEGAVGGVDLDSSSVIYVGTTYPTGNAGANLGAIPKRDMNLSSLCDNIQSLKLNDLSQSAAMPLVTSTPKTDSLGVIRNTGKSSDSFTKTERVNAVDEIKVEEPTGIEDIKVEAPNAVEDIKTEAANAIEDIKTEGPN